MNTGYYPKPSDIRFGVHRICKKCGRPYKAESVYSRICWQCLWGMTKTKGSTKMTSNIANGANTESGGMDARQQRLANFRSQFQGQRVWAEKSLLLTMGVQFHVLNVRENPRGKYGLTYEVEILLDTELGTYYQEKTDTVDDPVQWLSFTAVTKDGEIIESRRTFFVELGALVKEIGPVLCEMRSFPTPSGNDAYTVNVVE